ncbi:MAG: secretin and TonB N-terminal domain-containing protein [Candidatus Omnitrophica bacterium]|nr:secretin and TonB N-terminal domain-containing protein [Candidatus Omnitrophota bacterium]
MKNKSAAKLIALTVAIALALCQADVSFLAAQTVKEEKPAEPSAQAEAQAKEAAAVPVAAPSDEATASVTREEAATTITPGNVTVNFKGADIRTVLTYLSEVSGVDIVPAPDVKGSVDLKLTNKPWKTALDIIVKNYGFAYEIEGDIIRVVTLDKMRMEDLTSQAFTLNYARAEYVVNSLRDMLSERGKATFDARTNTILIVDAPTRIYRIGQIIEKLDKRTEQVLIEALVIETTLGKDEKLGIDWNVVIAASGAKRPTTFPFDYFDTGSKYLDKYTPLVQTGAPAVTYPAGGAGAAVVTQPGAYPTGADGTGNLAKGFPYIDYAQDWMRDTFTFGTLDFSQFKAVLEMLSTRDDSSVVANPRITTLDNVEANIHVGPMVIMPTFERNAQTGKMEVTGYLFQEEERDPKTGEVKQEKRLRTGIDLRVKPHVNETGDITIELRPEVSDDLRLLQLDPVSGITAPAVFQRTARTQTVVRDGETVFIGGLIRDEDKIVDKRLPILGDALGDVPYLGLLFSHKAKVKQKKELIFFVTVHRMVPGKRPASAPDIKNVNAPTYTVSNKGLQADDKKKNKKGFLGLF